jgi:ribosomal protein L12E/L44/L45/RPP1/RPP2
MQESSDYGGGDENTPSGDSRRRRPRSPANDNTNDCEDPAGNDGEKIEVAHTNKPEGTAMTTAMKKAAAAAAAAAAASKAWAEEAKVATKTNGLARRIQTCKSHQTMTVETKTDDLLMFVDVGHGHPTTKTTATTTSTAGMPPAPTTLRTLPVMLAAVTATITAIRKAAAAAAAATATKACVAQATTVPSTTTTTMTNGLVRWIQKCRSHQTTATAAAVAAAAAAEAKTQLLVAPVPHVRPRHHPAFLHARQRPLC